MPRRLRANQIKTTVQRSTHQSTVGSILSVSTVQTQRTVLGSAVKARHYFVLRVRYTNLLRRRGKLGTRKGRRSINRYTEENARTTTVTSGTPLSTVTGQRANRPTSTGMAAYEPIGNLPILHAGASPLPPQELFCTFYRGKGLLWRKVIKLALHGTSSTTGPVCHLACHRWSETAMTVKLNRKGKKKRSQDSLACPVEPVPMAFSVIVPTRLFTGHGSSYTMSTFRMTRSTSLRLTSWTRGIASSRTSRRFLTRIGFTQ